MPSSVPPKPPSIALEITEDLTAGSRCDEGYLRIKRRKMRARHVGGSISEPFQYDVVERWNQDAVAVVLHFVRDGIRTLYLRSALRPPLSLRDDLLAAAADLPGASDGSLWEIPAGLVERDERTPEGLVGCVVRETREEVGLSIEPAQVRALGGPIFPSAGIIGECVFLFEAEVDPSGREAPEGDGPLEAGAEILEVPLATALAWCDAGLLPDAKTEIAIRRLSARMGAAP
jgi:ADP-ribose pyrophosphatase